jgi:hypothetical protein
MPLDPFPAFEAAQDAIDAWVYGYNHRRPHQSLAMASPATVFRPAPVDPVPSIPVATDPLIPGIVEVVVPPRPRPAMPSLAEELFDSTIHAVEWQTALTPRARLLLPGNQQFKFTAALARREVTVWASDRSIHVVLDGTVIRTRPSRLSEHDLRNLLGRGARIAGSEPARGAVTVDMLTTSTVIEVARTVARDGCVGLGGHKVLLDSSLVGQRVTVRFEGALMHVVADGRPVKTLPAPLPPDQRAAVRGARPTSEPLPAPAPPQRAMRRVAANGTVTRRRPTTAHRTHLPRTNSRYAEDTPVDRGIVWGVGIMLATLACIDELMLPAIEGDVRLGKQAPASGGPIGSPV